eukprot:bmy_01147T0
MAVGVGSGTRDAGWIEWGGGYMGGLPQGAAEEPSSESYQVRAPQGYAGSRWKRAWDPGTESPRPGNPHVPRLPLPQAAGKSLTWRPRRTPSTSRRRRSGRRDRCPGRGPGPARRREGRGGRRERAHPPPPPPEPARGARGQGGADRPSHSPGLRAGTHCRHRCRRVRPSPPAPAARGEKVTASWPAGRRARGGRGHRQGDRGAARTWHPPLGSRSGGGGPACQSRPGCQQAGPERWPRERRRDAPSFRVVLQCSRREEWGRELEGKAGCGRRGRVEGSLGSFLPWERKGRNGEGAMCRNVWPLGEARAESGKWGGPLGRWSRHPAPPQPPHSRPEQRMRSSRPVPLGPRQPAAPLPTERPSAF